MSAQANLSKAGVPSVIDFVVKLQLGRLTDGKTHSVSIDPQWKQVIGQQGIDEIAAKIGRTLKTVINVTKNNGRIIMTPTMTAKPEPSNGEQKMLAVKRGAIPRPPNSFILYRQHYHEATKKEHPEFNNGTISQVLGAKWRAESPAVKDHFDKLAKHLKDIHTKLYPGYAYQPRKAAEKKRRMTPKKVAKLAALANALQSTDSVDDEANFAGFEGPETLLPAFEESAFGDNGNVLEFVLGDPNITPKTFEAMLEAHNEKFRDTNTTGPNGVLVEDCVAAAPHEVVAQDLCYYDQIPNWAPFDSIHMLDNGPMDEEFLDLFVDKNDVSKGIRMDKQSLGGNKGEVARQATLFQPFILDTNMF